MCTQCRYFVPAATWIKPPAWGHCTRQVARASRQDVQIAGPVFVWSDNTCEGFEPGSQSVPCG
jgi:hypothetical protein